MYGNDNPPRSFRTFCAFTSTLGLTIRFRAHFLILSRSILPSLDELTHKGVPRQFPGVHINRLVGACTPR